MNTKNQSGIRLLKWTSALNPAVFVTDRTCLTTQYPRVSTQIGGITMCAKSEEAFNQIVLSPNTCTIYIRGRIRSIRSAQRLCNKAGLKIKILDYGGRTKFLFPRMSTELDSMEFAPCSQFLYEEKSKTK